MEDAVVFEICEYIKTHMNEKLTYEHLQQVFFVSRHDLSVIFQKKVGLSVTAYIIDQRLEWAVSLIGQGVGIREASVLAGFKTYSNFYKVFMRNYGICPKEYFLKRKKDHDD